MTTDDAATIFALSSGSPPAAIGVIRISGPGAGPALVALAGRMPLSRRASYASLRDPADAALLDRGLILWFPGPRTATGEDLAELHIHGGRAVADAVLRVLGAIAGLRAASPGEFTRRALANGVIDLAEAEGLADLLSAETELQRRVAIGAAGGGLSRRVEAWRIAILAASARVEAMLDFADEGDVTSDDADVRADIARLAGEIEALLARPPAERLRDGLRVVLAGPPNAGKSTLLNALVGREAAIVSPIAGTTRDVIEAPVSLAGIPFVFSDTAGLRASDDPIEQVGVARAEAVLAGADIILWLGGPGPDPARSIAIHAQADVDPPVPDSGRVVVSAVTGEGMAELVDLLVARARTLLPQETELAINRRQRDALQQAFASLRSIAGTADLLIVAEHLRHAREAFDAVVGRSGVEDMLDALFGRFCIGK